MPQWIDKVLHRAPGESWTWSLLEPEVRAALESQVERELARRSLSGALVYFAVCTLLAWSTRYASEHPVVVFLTGSLTLGLGLVRIGTARRLLAGETPKTRRDQTLFLVSLYSSFIVWGLFCGWTVHLYAAQWTSMFLLLSTAALAGGATGSLAPDVRLASICLAILFAPTVVASLVVGDRQNLAVAIAACFYLSFLIVQVRDNWHSFWTATVTAERERLSRSRDRKRAEMERVSLVTAIEQAAEEIIITDAEGNIEYCNPSFERVTGYLRSEVIGCNPRFLKSGKHDDKFYRDLWTTIGTGGVWAGRFTNRKKDGTLYDADGTISPIHDDAGKLTGFVSARHDVTERLRLEQQLSQAQKMESLGRLAGGIAHDFNNLLTVIGGYGGVLSTALAPSDPRRKHALEISKAAERAANLTRQLLTVSRKQIIKPKPVNLSALVLDMQGMLQRLVGDDVEVVTSLDAGLGLVRVDPDQMSQVLMNLVANARDAMPNGGQIRILTANSEGIEPLSRPPEAELLPAPAVLLEVTDSGVGIDDDALQYIFEPFFTTKDKARGTGLGLSTVYSIVEQADGRIQVASKVGRGTTFSIYLPQISDQITEEPVAEAPVVPLSGSETVLVVEDHDDVRRLISWTLRSRGFRVLEANNGSAAIAQSSRFAGVIHLLVTDVIMPGMTGREVAERLLASRASLKVLFISGYSGEVIAHRGILDASVAYLPKPFTPDQLVSKVRDVLAAGADTFAHGA